MAKHPPWGFALPSAVYDRYKVITAVCINKLSMLWILGTCSAQRLDKKNTHSGDERHVQNISTLRLRHQREHEYSKQCGLLPGDRYDAAVRARGSRLVRTFVLFLGVHVVVKIWPVKAYAARRPEGALYSLNPTYRKLPGDLCFNVWEAFKHSRSFGDQQNKFVGGIVGHLLEDVLIKRRGELESPCFLFNRF